MNNFLGAQEGVQSYHAVNETYMFIAVLKYSIVTLSGHTHLPFTLVTGQGSVMTLLYCNIQRNVSPKLPIWDQQRCWKKH